MSHFCAIIVTLFVCVGALNIAPLSTKQRVSKVVSSPSDKDLLLQAISGLNYGVKATKADDANIESLVQKLISSSGKKSIKSPADAFSLLNGGKNLYQRGILGGDWELQYTNGPDVLSIAKIPGVKLDYVGQVVDTEANTITNLVNASGFLADTAQQVVVEVRQVSPDKVELDFVGTKIKFVKIFGQTKIFGIVVDEIKPIDIKFDKSKIEESLKKSGRPTPAFEIEYLDDTLRVQRTSEGRLFIIKKIIDESEILPNRGGGLGPWLEDKIGENGMKTLGAVSLTPYLFFAITAVRQFMEAQ